MAPSRAALQTLRRCAYAPSSAPSPRAFTCRQPQALIHPHHLHRQTRSISHPSAYTPRILDPSLWRGLIPRFLRRSDPPSPGSNSQSPEDPKSQAELDTIEAEKIRKQNAREARFIVIFSLMIGSWGINTLNLRRNYLEFTSDTEAKLELLREVVRKVKAGEEVDIAKELGTGIEKEERAWEDVIKELEKEDTYIRDRKRKSRRAKAQKVDAEQQEQQQGASDGGQTGWR